MVHESEKKQYDADAQWHPRPWELWEWNSQGPVVNNGKRPDYTWNQCMVPINWNPDTIYRRKPDAPERNCAMCKFSTTIYYFSCCLDLSRDPFSLKSMAHPEWCPLAQKEETKQPDLLTAARDLLEYLEEFELMLNVDQVKALRKAIDKAEST